MSKKTYHLVSGLLDGAAIIACTLVVYFNPPMSAAIVAAIGIVKTAADQVCQLFITE